MSVDTGTNSAMIRVGVACLKWDFHICAFYRSNSLVDNNPTYFSHLIGNLYTCIILLISASSSLHLGLLVNNI